MSGNQTCVAGTTMANTALARLADLSKDVELIKSVMPYNAKSSRKADVISQLRRKYPEKFKTTAELRAFMKKLIEAGRVAESGEGASVAITILSQFGKLPSDVSSFSDCIICDSTDETSKMIPTFIRENCFLCEGCYSWGDPEFKSSAVNRVVSTLTMMAENDDIAVPDGILRTTFVILGACETKRKVILWIDEAIRRGQVKTFIRKSQGKKHLHIRFICLPEFYDACQSEFPLLDELDTTEQEQHIRDMLYKRDGGWATRKEIILSLSTTFANMGTPQRRSQVFQNGGKNGLFYVKKNPWGQVVALTELDAKSALKELIPASND